jgi:hypothetical protein
VEVFNSLAINSGLVGAISAAIVMALLLTAVRTRVEPAHGETVLQYGKLLRWLVYLFWACWLGGLTAAFFAPASARLALVALLTVFFIAILAMHLEFHYVRVSYNSDGITAFSPWRASRVIAWPAVNRAWYSAAAQWHVIDTANSGRIRLHDFLNGVQSLLDELESRGIPVKRAGRLTNRRS